MKYLKATGLALATLGLVLVAAPAASAQTSSKSCTATALVRPLLGNPACVTPVNECPQFERCVVRADMTARTLIGLGGARAVIRIYDIDHPEDGAQTGCAGPTSCSATLGPYPGIPGGGGERPGTRYVAACSWTGTSLGVLASIGCRTSQEVMPRET